MNMGANFTPGSPGGDDLLARATAALQRTPMVDGPSTETLDRTLAALEAAASSPKTRFAFRRKMMFTLLKIAAAVLIAAGSLFYLGGPYLVGASVTFEEVAQKLQNAHTFSYVMTMEFPDAKSADDHAATFQRARTASESRSITGRRAHHDHGSKSRQDARHRSGRQVRGAAGRQAARRRS